MISVSLIILTWNRRQSVETSLHANLLSAGYPIKELIHVDNGSEDGFALWFNRRFDPTVQVLHRENLGVAIGYNRGLLLATGTHVIITGCDRVLPNNWLKTWVTCYEKIPETGCIACYTKEHKERWRGDVICRNGINILPSIPVEARICSREFLLRTGFWREDFGLYGYEDSEWSDRAERVARENGLRNYSLPGVLAEHLPDTDFGHTLEGKTYKEYKDSIHTGDPSKDLNYNRFQKCHQLGSPYYNPYSRIEPRIL